MSRHSPLHQSTPVWRILIASSVYPKTMLMVSAVVALFGYLFGAQLLNSEFAQIFISTPASDGLAQPDSDPHTPRIENETAFRDSYPNFLLWFLIAALGAGLVAAGPIALTRIFLRATAGLVYAMLRSWLEAEQRKAEDKQSSAANHLSWTEIMNFLEAEEFDSIISRIQRQNMTQFLSLRPFQSTRVAISHLWGLIELLFAVKGAIELAGPSFDANRGTQFVFQDEQRSIRRFIARIEYYASLLELVETIKRALITLTVFGAFWGATFVISKNDALSRWGYDDLARQLFIAAAAIFGAVIAVRLLILGLSLLARAGEIAFRSRGMVSAAFSVIVVSLAVLYAQNFTQAMPDAYSPLAITEFSILEPAKNYAYVTLEILGRLAVPGSDIAQFLPSISSGALLALRLISAAVVVVLFLRLVATIADAYEYGVLSRVNGGLTAPPELIKLAGGFLGFVLATALVYASVLEAVKGVAPPTVEITQTAPSSSPDGESQIVKRETQAEFSGVQDFIPYSVFLAVLGALLTLATRDLLENYFAGIAVRVDSPFEVGDRITIDDGRICEVQRIGVRAVQLYEIGTNSVVNMSHSLLTEKCVRNFSAPTLDLRRTVEFVFLDDAADEDTLRNTVFRDGAGDMRAMMAATPARAEGLLLTFAMLTDGVKRPKAPDFKLSNENIAALIRIGQLPKLALADRSSRRRSDPSTQQTAVTEFFNAPRYYSPEPNTVLVAPTAEDDMVFELENYTPAPITDEMWRSLAAIDDRSDGRFFGNLFVGELVQVIDNLTAAVGERRSTVDADTLARLADEDWEGEERRKLIGLVRDIRTRIYELAALTVLFEDITERQIGLSGRFKQLQAMRRSDLNRAGLAAAARVSVRISASYAEIAALFWDIRDIRLNNITKTVTRQLDKASLALLDPPRVFSQRLLSENADPYYHVRLDATLKTAEQSDEIIHHITTLAARHRKDFGLR